jgi:probable rRNA maturation factor
VSAAAESRDSFAETALDLVIEAGGWDCRTLEPLVREACGAVAAHMGLPDGCEVVVLACDDARIAALNAEFRGKPRATNVLSWPSQDLAAEQDGAAPFPPESDFPGEPPALGDIALAYETCLAEAEAAGRPISSHLRHLVVHGMLHLLGYDHERDGDAALMENLEVEILDAMGVPNPYD